MSENLKYTKPFELSQCNKNIISLLFGSDEALTKEFVPRSDVVPTLKDADVKAIVEENNSIIRNKNRVLDHLKKYSQGPIEDSSDDLMEVDNEPKKFIKLSEFMATNLKEQVNTISIKKFPKTIRPSLIEYIIDKCVQSSNANGEFGWSMLESDYIDDRILYIRFPSVEDLKCFHYNIKDVIEKAFEDLRIIFDLNSTEYIKTECQATISDVQKLELSNEIVNTVKNNRPHPKNIAIHSTHDLDQAIQFFDTYQVNDAELIDVPKDLREKIRGDIIKFRSKVLQMEKETRKYEVEKERRQAKNRLKRIFKGIEETKPDITMINNEEELDSSESDEDEYNNLSKTEYESLITKRRNEQDENEYQNILSEVEKLGKTEKRSLKEQISSLRSYEDNLINSKAQAIEELRNLDDLSSISTQQSSKEGARSALYYTNYPEYLRMRNLERSKEADKDKQDIKDEIESQKIREESSQSLAQVMPAEKRELEHLKAIENKISVSALGEAKLHALFVKIEELVEEYLGIKEDVLIEFIYQYLLKHDLEGNADLIDELSEPLDDDSAVVVNELENFIEELASS